MRETADSASTTFSFLLRYLDMINKGLEHSERAMEEQRLLRMDREHRRQREHLRRKLILRRKIEEVRSNIFKTCEEFLFLTFSICR